ncbi:hypothetical protein EOL70_14195 [Leucothrix sargassi]|nr:hypothetical protein EOL70_14195 [Leucothrix sargassi]
MSEITVKKLSEMVGAPVETLLRQMQDAGIHVKGENDSITDRQKLDLLEHIRTSTGKTEETQKPGKITLKKRTTGEAKQTGASKDSGTVVRRKKTILRKNTTAPAAAETPAKEAPASKAPVEPTADTGTSRTAELAKELEAERKAREQAVIASREKAAEKAATAKADTPKPEETAQAAVEAVTPPLLKNRLLPQRKHLKLRHQLKQSLNKLRNQLSPLKQRKRNLQRTSLLRRLPLPKQKNLRKKWKLNPKKRQSLRRTLRLSLHSL